MGTLDQYGANDVVIVELNIFREHPRYHTNYSIRLIGSGRLLSRRRTFRSLNHSEKASEFILKNGDIIICTNRL